MTGCTLMPEDALKAADWDSNSYLFVSKLPNQLNVGFASAFRAPLQRGAPHGRH